MRDSTSEGEPEEPEMRKSQESQAIQEERRESPREAEAERSQEEVDRILRLLDQEKRRADEYLTNLKYLQADFENYRKRMDREVREIEEFSTSGLIKKLLPVVDDLDIGLSAAEANPQAKEFVEGMGMVRKRLLSALESQGLKGIDAIGKPFDPELHEAVDKVQGTGDQDLVVEEVRKGYMLKGKVLRPSMVKVELAMKKNSSKDGESEK